MVISAYQVNNVLRVYRDQLRHGNLSNRAMNEGGRLPDRISISNGGRQKALIEKITFDITEKIARPGNEGKIEKEAFKEIEDGFGVRLDVAQKGTSELLFKVIDADGETIKSFSVEDPKFSANQSSTPVREKQAAHCRPESEV